MAKQVYILNTVGISLPDYAREDLRVGMSVSLDTKVGDGYAARGFLTKANAVKAKVDKDVKALEKKLAAVIKERDDITKERDELLAKVEAK